MDMDSLLRAHGVGVGKKIQPSIIPIFSGFNGSTDSNLREIVSKSDRTVFGMATISSAQKLCGFAPISQKLFENTVGANQHSLMLSPDETKLFIYYRDGSNNTFLGQVNMTTGALTRTDSIGAIDQHFIVLVDESYDVYLFNHANRQLIKRTRDGNGFYTANAWVVTLAGSNASLMWHHLVRFSDGTFALPIFDSGTSRVTMNYISAAGALTGQPSPSFATTGAVGHCIPDPSDKSFYCIDNSTRELVKVNSSGGTVWRCNFGGASQTGYAFIGVRKGHVYLWVNNTNGHNKIIKVNTSSGGIVHTMAAITTVGGTADVNAAKNHNPLITKIMPLYSQPFLGWIQD
ncbi:hypothetical protein [Brevibacillus sp. H7]|uniref:hypothetical protein n=1 Tax=Brevibacillus sp. H7 TaxID=3349138 RepID=UPI003804745D